VRRPEAFQGVLEMGGASMQITFMPQGGCTPHKFAYHLRLPGVQGLLYTHSYLGYGLDTARANLTALLRQANASSDPCMPRGHSSSEGLAGGGNYSACYDLVSRLFRPSDEGEEEQQPEHGSQQPLHKSNVPCLAGRFLGIENFYWTARALELPPLATVADLAASAQQYCARSAEELQRDHPPEIQEQYMLRYCFGATYIVALLDEGIGFHRRRHKLEFTSRVERPDGSSLELDWALGAVLTHLMQHSGFSLYAFKGAGRGHAGTAGSSSSSPRQRRGSQAAGL
jgi:apyrase